MSLGDQRHDVRVEVECATLDAMQEVLDKDIAGVQVKGRPFPAVDKVDAEGIDRTDNGTLACAKCIHLRICEWGKSFR